MARPPDRFARMRQRGAETPREGESGGRAATGRRDRGGEVDPLSSAGPVLHAQTPNPAELLDVVRDESGVQRKSVGAADAHGVCVEEVSWRQDSLVTAGEHVSTLV